MPLREDNILEGSLVRLAALTEDDAVHLVRFQRNAAYSRLLDTWPARPRSKDEIVKRIKDEVERDTVYHFSIRRVDDDEFLGFAELDGIDWSHGSCGLGIGLGVFAVEAIRSIDAFAWLSGTYSAGLFARALVLAVGMGLMGTLYPAFRAARIMPIEALRYE